MTPTRTKNNKSASGAPLDSAMYEAADVNKPKVRRHARAQRAAVCRSITIAATGMASSNVADLGDAPIQIPNGTVATIITVRSATTARCRLDHDASDNV